MEEAATQHSGPNTKDSQSRLRARDCAGCANAVAPRNAPPALRLCACHPDYPGQLVCVTADDVGTRCRSFRLRREQPAAATAPPPGDDVRYIDLTGGFFALVDASDYAWLSKYTWRVTGGYSSYACTKIAHKTVYMHRLIMNPPPGQVVDHHNHNRWDNRRSNLRICSQAQNLQNRRKSRGTSIFKGVFWHTRRRKWLAVIGYQGKTLQIGFFDDEVEAARAYDRKARELFGAYACLNFPEPAHVVYLSGSICAHSRGWARLTVVHRGQDNATGRDHPRPKSETRNTKSETIANHRNSKSKPIHDRASAFQSLEYLRFGHCLGFRISGTGSLRVSSFVLSPVRGPPCRRCAVLSKHPLGRFS